MQAVENLLGIDTSQPAPDSPDGLRGKRIGFSLSNISPASSLGIPLLNLYFDGLGLL